MITTSSLMGRRTSSGSRRQTERARRAWLPPVGQKTEKLTKSDGVILVRGNRGGAIRVIGGDGRDAQDDAVAVLDLEGQEDLATSGVERLPGRCVR